MSNTQNDIINEMVQESLSERDTQKLYENNDIKITVEEITPFKFIATKWDKNICLEFDRTVSEFETYGGAVDKAFDYICQYMDSRSGL